ncbi:uncharacterized protein LOC135579318 isoform X2 [Columba livia]|uniref:uncharacterized protein LOC135579318 isoform X2 n=1 Tax=Columba livia TaxID=8932 RepID=UPI0031B9BCA4
MFECDGERRRRRKAGKKGVGGDGAPEMEPVRTGDDALAASFRGWERAQLSSPVSPPPYPHAAGTAKGRTVCSPPKRGALRGRGRFTRPSPQVPGARTGQENPTPGERHKPTSVCLDMPGKKNRGQAEAYETTRSQGSVRDQSWSRVGTLGGAGARLGTESHGSRDGKRWAGALPQTISSLLQPGTQEAVPARLPVAPTWGDMYLSKRALIG